MMRTTVSRGCMGGIEARVRQDGARRSRVGGLTILTPGVKVTGNNRYIAHPRIHATPPPPIPPYPALLRNPIERRN